MTWLAMAIVAGDLLVCDLVASEPSTHSEPVSEFPAVHVTPKTTAQAAGTANLTRRLLEFRRLFVPHDRPGDWPAMRETYLPVPAAQFEQLAAELEGRPLASAELAVHVRSAIYTTRVSSSPVLHGEARLVIEHRAPGRAALKLGACNLAIQNLQWDQEGTPPVIGRSATGEPVVLIDRSGELRFDWLLRGTSAAPGHCDFTLRLPPASANQVSCLVDDTERIEAGEGLTLAGDREGANSRWWHVTLGSGQDLSLAVRAAHDDSAAATTRVRQSLKYEVTGQGIAIAADLEYERYEGPLDTFEFVGDAGFELIDVQIGDEPAVVAASPRRADGTIVYTARGRTPNAVARQLVKVTGLAQRVDEARPLASIRPTGAIWQSGRSTLTIKSPLWLDSLDLTKCRQAGVASLPPPEQGEVYEFEWYEAGAAISACIVPRPARWQATIGTHLDIKEGEVAGRSEIALRSESGETFAISGIVEPSWLIDTVETIPGDALTDWSYEPRPSGDHNLTIRLGRPLRAEQNLTLVVTGRRPRWPIDQAFRAAELAMLSLPAEHTRSSTLNLRTTAPFRLDLGRDPTVLRVDPTLLTPQELELVDRGADSLLVALDADNWDVPLTLRADRPGMSSDIRVTVAFGEGQFSERYEVVCVPKQTRVRKTWVRFSQPRTAPIIWRAENAEGPPLAARLLGQDEQRRLELPPGGEVWEVTLTRATSAPFKLFGARASNLGAVNPVSLLSLPEADQQTGRIDVQLLDATALEISAPRLRGLSLERPDDRKVSDGVAAYAYDPRVDADPTAAPAISLIRRVPSGVRASIVIWNAHVHSTIAGDGVASHTATYQLELAALDQLQLRVPAEFEAMHVQIDGQQQPVTMSGDQLLSVSLPSSGRYATLVVELRSRRSLALTFWSRCKFPLPLPIGADTQVLATQWSISLPQGLAILGGDAPWHFGAKAAADWRERLFGEFARQSNAVVLRGDSFAFGENTVVLYSSGIDAASQSRVVIGNSSTLRLLGWGVFWVSIGLVWWRQPSGRWCLAYCGAAAALAIVLPTPYWALVNRIWIGLIAGKLSSRILPSITESRHSQDFEQPHTTLLASAKLVLLIATTAGFVLAVQRVVSAAEVVLGEVPQVLIPARNGQDPTGDRYLVPEALWRDMQRAAGELARQPHGWLLAEGDYRVALESARNGASLRMSQIVASYDLHVFAGNTRVMIPFGEGSTEGSIQVRLDGQRIEAEQSATSSGVEFVVSETGTYRLELQFEPPADREVTAGLSFRVPGLPLARARVDLPPDSPELELNTAAGPVLSGAGQQYLVGPIGAQERLELRWPETIGATGLRALTEVEQLTSVSMQPGAVVVQVRCRISDAAGLQTLQLETSDDLRPLPPSDETRPAITVNPAARARQVLTVPVIAGTDGTAVAEVTLLAERGSGVGQFAAPWIKPLGVRVTRQWLAVSVASGLEVAEQMIEPFETAPAEEFAAVWGAMTPAPMRVYVHDGNNVLSWSISSRPRVAQVSGRAALDCHYARGRVRLNYHANLQTAGGSLYRHVVEVPPDLNIEGLVLTAARAPRRTRWALDEHGRLTIFLAAPLSGEHELSIVGTLAAPDSGEEVVPVVRLTSAALKSSELSISRNSSVLVSVTPRLGLRTMAPASPATTLIDSREVARFDVIDARYDAQVAVETNRPEVSVSTATVMDREENNWTVTWHADFDIADGTLDRLRVWLPAEVAEPIQVSPPGQTSITTVVGEPRRLLTVVPSEPLGGTYHLELRAGVSPKSGRQVTAPSLESADTAREERYLVLPSRAGGQGVLWQTRGLARAELPEGLAKTLTARSDTAYVAHGILADDFEAIVHEAVDGGASQVRLAEYSIELFPDGRWHGLATFDLDPADRKFLPLTVPGDCELVQTWVEQVPGCLVPDGTGNYRLLLHTAQIPQRVEVLFRGRSDQVQPWSREVSLVVPWPGELPIERSMWRVDTPPEADAIFRKNRNPLTAAQYEIVRAASLSGVVDTLCDALNPPLETELIRAAGSWLERLQSTRFQLKGLIDSSPTNQRDAILAQLEALDAASARLLQRIPDAVATNAREELPSATDGQAAAVAELPTGLPATAARLRGQLASARTETDLRAVYQGRQSRFTCEFEQRPGSQRAVSWALAVGFLLLIPLGLWNGTCQTFGAWFVARPTALGVVCGAIWALWLAWPVLGLALMLASLLIWTIPGSWIVAPRTVGQ